MSTAPSPTTARPLGPGRWRVDLDLGDEVGHVLPLEPATITFRSSSPTAPGVRVETVAAPTSAAPGRWSITVVADDPDGPGGLYDVGLVGEPAWRVQRELRTGRVTAPAFASADPSVDYLARDFEALSTRMQARIAEQVGAPLQSSPVAQSVGLVELLAYLGDQLSYYQDAVATEAYLATARRRVSVTRHAALLDYTVDQGANARTWVRFSSRARGPFLVPAGTPVVGFGAAETGRIRLSDADRTLDLDDAVVFETMCDLEVHPEAPPLTLYPPVHPGGWLAPGATSAVVDGHHDALGAGATILLQAHGEPGAEAATRVVRLTAVGQDVADDAGRRTAVTVIEWAIEDALPTRSEPWPTGFEVLLHNLVLADHGRTTPLTGTPPVLPAPVAGRPYWPSLPEGPVTFAAPLPGDAATIAARDLLTAAAGSSVACVVLEERDGLETETWLPASTLLDSGPFSRRFVVEIEDDGTAHARFGDGVNGLRPTIGAELHARVRVGGGAAGNVGRLALSHVVSSDARMLGAVNVVAAAGGRDAEELTSVRLLAPQAFRVNERAVTADDHVDLAEGVPGVVDAAVSLTTTGSWPVVTVHLLVDRAVAEVARTVELARQAFAGREPIGVELTIAPAAALAADVGVAVAVQPGFDLAVVAGQVHQALEGSFLAPGHFRLGTPLHASEVIAVVTGATGVADAVLTRFALASDAPDAAPREVLQPSVGEHLHLPLRLDGGVGSGLRCVLRPDGSS